MMWTPALAIAGGVLALGPIIIHILFRRRYRVVEFAAMRFLLDSLRRSKQRLRLEEILIIALRVLACLLIGLTLANIRAAGYVPGRHAATRHVFILDDSLSMGQRVGGATVFQKALTRMVDAIGHMDDGDTVAVLSACQPETGRPLGHLELVRNLKDNGFLQRITAMKPTDLRAHFAEALAAARTLVPDTGSTPTRVYLVSDFRRSDFADPATLDPLRKAFASLGDKTDLVLMDFGLPCRGNLTVERIDLADKLAVARVGTNFEVTVRNTGTDTVEGASITVRCGDATLPVIPLGPVAAGETVRKPFCYVLPSPGFAALSAAVSADALPGDDQASLALAVYENLRVLIVDGSTNPSSPASGSYCLAHALDPSEEGAFGQRVEVIDPSALAEGDLDRFDLVLLTNVRELAAGRDADGKAIYPQVQALERFVRNGGGLGIFLGPNANPDFYNGPLYAGGLCPLKLSTNAVATPDPAVFNRLRPDSIAAEPMLRLFANGGGKFTQLIRFYAFHRATVATPAETTTRAAGVSAPQVLARFDDKDQSPALIRRSFGKGTVIAWTTVPDTRWNDWHKDLSFLPVINDMAWQLARRRGEDLTAPVGQRIAYALPTELADATAITLKTPAYPAADIEVLRPQTDGRSKTVEYLPATHAGLYEMTFTRADRSQRTVYFARTIDPAEAELAKADEKQLASVVGRTYSYLANLSVEASTAAAEEPRRSYVWLFMGLLLGILGLEVFLAQRFGHYAERNTSAERSAA